jgi:hypothetical protein
MRHLSLCLLLATATTAAAQTPSGKGDHKIVREPITLTGCVVAGTEPNTYMLTHIARADKPVGTSGTVEPNVIYWLSSPRKLKPHVGHQVEIVGILDDDVKTTKVKAKDGKVELKNGDKKVEVPEGTTAADSLKPDGTKRTSYKVEVRSVRMLSEGCSK